MKFTTSPGALMATRKRAPRRTGEDVVVRIAQKLVPKLPHERDESTDRTPKSPRKVILQAAADLAGGQQDTDRSPQTNRLASNLNSKN